MTFPGNAEEKIVLSRTRDTHRYRKFLKHELDPVTKKKAANLKMTSCDLCFTKQEAPFAREISLDRFFPHLSLTSGENKC